MRRIATGLAIAYALMMLVMLVVLIGTPVTLGKVAFGLVMLVWTSLPVTGLLLRWPHSRTALIGGTASFLFGCYAYYDIMVVNSDPQSALGLIIVPIYQSILAGLVWALDALVRMVLRKAAQ